MNSPDLSTLSNHELYSQLASLTAQSIPEGWASATVHSEIEGWNSGLTYGEYIALDSAETKYFLPKGSYFDLFRELRRRMQQADQLPWNKAELRLEAEGHFACTFSYPDGRSGDEVAGAVAGLDAIEYVPPPPPPIALPADLSALSEDEIDGWFYKVAQDAIKAEWSLAILRAEIESLSDGSSMMRYRTVDEPGELAMDAGPESIWALCAELWKRAAQTGEPWSELTVQITPEGSVRRITVYPDSPVPADLTGATNAQLTDWLREMTVRMIDAPWVSALAVGRFADPPRRGGSALFFHPESAPEAEWATLASMNHNRLFLALWQRWKAHGQDWSELQVHLQPNGTVSFEGVPRSP